jgi:hypothetical protein
MDMNLAKLNETEKLVQFSRRQLWLTLAVAVLFAVLVVVDLSVPGLLPRHAGLPLAIIAVVVIMHPKTKGIDLSASNPAMKAIRNDELRQAAQARAWRNGFLALLVLQPVAAFLLASSSGTNSLAIMAGLSSWTGAVVFLASLLYYDR